MADLPEAKLQRGLRLAIVAMGLIHLFALALPQLLANASVYRPLAVEVVAFVMIFAVLAGIGVAVLRERPLWRWPMFLVLLVAAILALTGIPPDHLVDAAEWSFGVVCWAGLLLFLDKGFLAVVMFMAGHLVLRLVLLASIGESDRASVVGAVIFNAEFLAYQLGITLAATLLRRMAGTVSDAVRDGERLRTEEAVAERLHLDRQERYADSLPLLAGLAAGVLDPADERVRTRCAVEAGRMRRLLAERDEVADPLMHELQACVDTAERRGITVYLGACGSRPAPPLAVRRALTEPVLTVLATASAQARVTVIGSPDAVTVSVVADGDPPAEVSGDDMVTVTRLAENGRHWVEATWQT